MPDYVFADAGISEVWSCYEEMNAFKKEYAEKNGGIVRSIPLIFPVRGDIIIRSKISGKLRDAKP